MKSLYKDRGELPTTKKLIKRNTIKKNSNVRKVPWKGYEFLDAYQKIEDENSRRKSLILWLVVRAMLADKKTTVVLGKYGRKTAWGVGEHEFYGEFPPRQSLGAFQAFSFRRFDGNGHSLSDIKNKKITLVYPGLFNDPFDTVFLQLWQHRLKTTDDKVQKELACIMLRYAEALKVRCFVRTRPLDSDPFPLIQNIEDVNLLMWAHYADSHKGFCVKYEFPETYDFHDDKKLRALCLGEICYEENIDLNSNLTFKDAFLKKSNIWKYEHEVRAVLFDTDCTEQATQINAPKMIAIYLGLRCSTEDKQKMLLALRGKPTPIYQMKVDPSNINHLIAERIG